MAQTYWGGSSMPSTFQSNGYKGSVGLSTTPPLGYGNTLSTMSGASITTTSGNSSFNNISATGLTSGGFSSTTYGTPVAPTVNSGPDIGISSMLFLHKGGGAACVCGGFPCNGEDEPNEWALDHSKQITNDEANEIPRFIISNAAASSLTKAVELLGLLGNAWPHMYAVCYSAKVSSFYMLAKAGEPLSMQDAKEAHRRFFGVDPKGGHKYRNKEERQQFPLEERLQEGLVGQKNAIFSVAGQIRRKENGWHSSNHPLVFLFMGSSGIGKTELAKQTAEYMHQGNAEGFIRIDMTEYQNQHEVSKFIGAPPGYAGYDDGGQLTKRLRRCPNAVVLFDEVEKAHPDILTCLLQTFDEGRLTDGKGELVECMDAIFVMTSNLAQREIADEAVRARAKMEDCDDPSAPEPLSEDFREKTILPLLKQHFKRDEFIGRINEILFFLPFTTEQLRALARKELLRWKSTAYKRHKIQLDWDKDVEDVLIKAYNLRFGVRSIQHEVERKVVSKLAQAHERDHIQQGTQVKLAVSPNDPTDIVMYKVEKDDEDDKEKKDKKEGGKK